MCRDSGSWNRVTLTNWIIQFPPPNLKVGKAVMLESSPLFRLWKFLVGWGSHFLSKIQEDRLHSIRAFPVTQCVKLVGVYLTSLAVNTGQVNLWNKSNLGGSIWVVWTTRNCKWVYPVLVVTVWWPQYGSIPVGECAIITISEAVTTWFWTEPFLTLLEFL